ncbi:MAG TPA: DUF2185 domain-containing protein [Allosphingosinicella sp.]
MSIAAAGLPAYSRAQPEGEKTSVTKDFRLSADQSRPLATGRGGAIASDRITVDGQPVGYMYRTAPHNQLDSGWAFLAGDETDAYMSDASNHAVYDVNTIANYDPEIIPLLDAPIGSAFIRTPSGLVLDPQGAPNE